MPFQALPEIPAVRRGFRVKPKPSVVVEADIRHRDSLSHTPVPHVYDPLIVRAGIRTRTLTFLEYKYPILLLRRDIHHVVGSFPKSCPRVALYHPPFVMFPKPGEKPVVFRRDQAVLNRSGSVSLSHLIERRVHMIMRVDPMYLLDVWSHMHTHAAFDERSDCKVYRVLLQHGTLLDQEKHNIEMPVMRGETREVNLSPRRIPTPRTCSLVLYDRVPVIIHHVAQHVEVTSLDDFVKRCHEIVDCRAASRQPPGALQMPTSHRRVQRLLKLNTLGVKPLQIVQVSASCREFGEGQFIHSRWLIRSSFAFKVVFFIDNPDSRVLSGGVAQTVKV